MAETHIGSQARLPKPRKQSKAWRLAKALLERFFYWTKASIGGQAVIEGVMLRGKNNWVVAVRKPDGEIITEKRLINSLSKKLPFLLRGIVALVETVSLGISALSFSAKEAGEGEISGKEIALSIVFALALAVGLFVLFPAWSVRWLNPYIKTSWVINLMEGFLRILIFVGYLFFVSKIKDISRVFEYHGAEHKVINAYEEGAELTPEAVSKYGTHHVGCGTSFLILVLIIWVLAVSFLGKTSFITRIGYRLLVLPLVAGISYEIIKLARKKKDSLWVKVLIAPGLALQGLTTKEPSFDQLEVAIYSLKKLLALERPRKGGAKAS